jgi:lipid A 3-O-deacylase
MAGLLLYVACTACADEPAARAQGAGGTLSIVLENDAFYDIDRHYTNGLRALWVPSGKPVPAWLWRSAALVPWFPRRGVAGHGYAFGQNMYTPEDIRRPDPPPDDRPYAGWLYASAGLGVARGDRLDLFSVTAGTVGPSALAERGQKLLHHVIGANQPQGWHTQLHDEPALVIGNQRLWRRLGLRTWSGNAVDFMPYTGFALGNVQTHLNAGVAMRYGSHLPDDYGPPRIQAGLPAAGSFAPMRGLGWYLFAGIEARAVAYNIFLDGNTDDESRQVDREPVVGDLQFGFVFSHDDVRFGYAHVLHTREFRTQHRDDAFGAFSVSVRY